MTTILISFIAVTLSELFLAAVLTLLPRLGSVGKTVSDKLARAPTLDVVVALLTWVPWLIAGLAGGWLGLLGALPGQAAAMLLWMKTHEFFHRNAVRGPTIFRALNQIVGRWRNHTALWVSLAALPALWSIRLFEIFLYPVLVWLLGFPRHKQADWINVSRQKFDGLVGHDLIWCLYCDWMTGVYSLGAVLRNVESFWCPIRFHGGKKCENCKLDFPDLEHGWVPADGTMHEVAVKLHVMYGDGRREWFGHRARSSVDRNSTEHDAVVEHEQQ